MSGVELEDIITEAFKEQDYIVFARRNHRDVLAVKPDMALAYLVECKDYELSRKQQSMAVSELNRNYTYALELLKDNRLYPERILRVLIAQAFSHQSRGILRYSPTAILNHIDRTQQRTECARIHSGELADSAVLEECDGRRSSFSVPSLS